MENQSTATNSRDGPASIEIQEVTEDCINYLGTVDHEDPGTCIELYKKERS